MTTPKTGSRELEVSQASKEATVNEAIRRVELGAGHYAVVDKDLTAPPGSCADGATYIVAATATDEWIAKEGQLAAAVGTNASNGWYFRVPEEGITAYVQDENTKYQFNGSSWTPEAASSVGGDTLDATEDLDAGDLVNIWASGGEAKVRKADAALGYDADGFVLANVSNGDPATVYLGGLITGLSGLTPGEPYFLSDSVPGGIDTAAGSGAIAQRVGKALSATSLRFRAETPV